MKLSYRPVAWTMTVFAIAAFCPPLYAQDETLEENLCVQCHGTEEIWDEETRHLFVRPVDLAADIHWQKGILCHDCHGGNPRTFELREAHALEDGFRKIESAVDMPGFCGHCHANPEYMQEFRPDSATDVVDRFWQSVHGQHLKGSEGPGAATCTSCHPKHEMRLVSDPLSAAHPRHLSTTCGACHQQQLVDLRKSVHSKAGERNEMDVGTVMDCNKCHGPDTHGMVAVQDPTSPVFLDHQVGACGQCHEKYLASYRQSVHGVGLEKSGLLVTAVCADCHGGHGVFYAADRRSTLHVSTVATTCGQCHHFLAEKLAESVHGGEGALGQMAERPAPGGTRARKPSCTDCHPGHNQPHPDSSAFRRDLPNRCGNCHAGLSDRYRMSLHGELTQLGFAPAAECADCHGAHDILPVNDPRSRLASGHRVDTCKQCHLRAVANFAQFDPHASHKDEKHYPLLYNTYAWLKFLLLLVLGLFALHALFWFIRSFVHTLSHGRDRPITSDHDIAVLEIPRNQRILYLLFFLSFFGLAITGLPLKYSDQAWAGRFANSVGGFPTTTVWHHFCAVVLLTCCVIYLVWAVRSIVRARREKVAWREFLWGPESAFPTARDFKDLLGMGRWFVGMGRKPKFERWTYWEKFDYWAVLLGVLLVGFSGLMLWYPNAFCLFLPGYTLNVAKVLHSEMALAISGCLFLIHAFHTHLRPEKFPLNLTWFSGLVSEEHLRRARPEYLERMRREGILEERRIEVPRRRRFRVIAAIAGSLLLAGIILLAAILLVKLGM